MRPFTPASVDQKVSPGQFALFRVVFGACLAHHFVFRENVTAGPGFAAALFAGLALPGLAFAAGILRRSAAVLLLSGWILAVHGDDGLRTPSSLAVGALLLFCALIPPGEPLAALRPRDAAVREWIFPPWIFRGAWGLLAAGYTFSGVTRLANPSWLDGTAFRHLLENPLARPGLARDLVLGLPDGVLALLTWAVVAAELLFLPLCLHRTGRLVAWTTLLAMHLGIVVVVDFADLSFGMVLLHLFTFDPRWFPARCDARRPVLLFDGTCGLCQAVVRFLLREDSAARLRFAPLQGAPAQAWLHAQGLPTRDFDSLVFVDDWTTRDPGAYRLRTAGALAAADEIGGMWRIAAWARFVPAALRDAAYRIVARSRYALFGTHRPTPLADPRWEDRFLADGSTGGLASRSRDV